MHRFVATDNSAQTIADITKIYQTQDQWGHLTLEEVQNLRKTS